MYFERYIEETISPVHLYILKELDALLDSLYIWRDSTHNDHLVLEGNNQELIQEYENKIINTCCMCGNNKTATYRDQRNKSEFQENMILCNECFENLYLEKEEQALFVNSYLYFHPLVNNSISRYTSSKLLLDSWIWKRTNSAYTGFNKKAKLSQYLSQMLKRKKIRYINPMREFDYAKFANYFFYGDELYVFTDNPIYRKYDIKSNFKDTVYYQTDSPNKFIIKVFYAGQDTGIRDIKDERIYTGDVIKFNGAISGAGMRPDIENVEMIGPISLSLKSLNYYPYNFLKPAFLGDMFDDVLCKGHIELLGNVFHKLTPNQSIDINRLVDSWYWNGYNDNAYSNILLEKARNNKLSSIKTPNFL